jgi:LysR family transcriptional regulator, glycine cleavage system transcriptional activator
MIDWRTLPSLTALRAFDAAASRGSFSAAARALNVTHAAVVQQVRTLEDHLGVELAYRDGRGIALTAEGTRLARALADGFGAIAGAVNDLRGASGDGTLRVTLTPAFATQWLMPRLGAFWAAHPDVPLSLHPDKRIVDLRREGLDLAIRFGRGDWPGVTSTFLTAAQYVIVGSPALLRGRTGLTRDQMSDMPWIVEQDWPEGLAWMRGFGLDTDRMQITGMPTEELALSAAREGYGLHIEAAALVETDVQNGDLIVVDAVKDDTLAYYLVTRPGPARPALKTFMMWLKSVV